MRHHTGLSQGNKERVIHAGAGEHCRNVDFVPGDVLLARQSLHHSLQTTHITRRHDV
jgi:hypothetical protein